MTSTIDQEPGKASSVPPPAPSNKPRGHHIPLIGTGVIALYFIARCVTWAFRGIRDARASGKPQLKYWAVLALLVGVIVWGVVAVTGGNTTTKTASLPVVVQPVVQQSVPPVVAPAATGPITLLPYDRGTVGATATLTNDGQLAIDAHELANLGPRLFYQVWLTDGARTNEIAIGALNADGRGTFRVSTQDLSTFSNIEVSVQTRNAPAGYSGVSVLRGSYR